MKKIIEYVTKHIYSTQILICFVFSLFIAIPCSIYSTLKGIGYMTGIGEIMKTFIVGILAAFVVIFVLIFPIIVTVYEILFFIISILKRSYNKKISTVMYDLFIIFIGVVLEIIILDLLHDVVYSANWSTQLYNYQVHSPLNTEYIVTFATLSFLYVVGMLVITIVSDKKKPPLITVLSISAMYIGVIEAILFTIQILGMHMTLEGGANRYEFSPDLFYICLIPINMIFILLRIMNNEIKAYKPDESRMSKIDSSPFLSCCNKLLNNSKNWPIIAAFLMIPLLGIVIVILTLFGQAPDAAIKAFTETADYTFSTKIPPQNIFYDEHYLCTVAAGGHRRIVKPIRMGKRHGHDVVVNRQLMIANAFEQILEEKVPKIHRRIRLFYDRYGFPIAKLIKTKSIADIVWFIMKPLEWIFLMVIYFVDVNPEDRIARQYL